MAIQPVQSQKHYSPVKTAAKAVAATTTVAVATGALLYHASKTGKLDAGNGNKYLETIKKALKGPADALTKKLDPMIEAAKPRIQGITSAVTGKVGELKAKVGDMKIGEQISSKFEDVSSWVRSKVSPERYL